MDDAECRFCGETRHLLTTCGAISANITRTILESSSRWSGEETWKLLSLTPTFPETIAIPLKVLVLYAKCNWKMFSYLYQQLC